MRGARHGLAGLPRPAAAPATSSWVVWTLRIHQPPWRRCETPACTCPPAAAEARALLRAAGVLCEPARY